MVQSTSKFKFGGKLWAKWASKNEPELFMKNSNAGLLLDIQTRLLRKDQGQALIRSSIIT